MIRQAPTQPVLACSQCGKMLAQSDLVPIAGNWVCGDCKAAFLSRVMAGGPGAASFLRYAGVGIRFGGRLIDGLVFLVPLIVACWFCQKWCERRSRVPGFNGTFCWLLSFSVCFTKS